MPTGHSALFAPIEVTTSNDQISIYYASSTYALTLTVATYETIEDLCQELETQLQTVVAQFEVTIQSDDTSVYGVTITITHTLGNQVQLLGTDGWSQFGFSVPTGSSSSHTSTGEIKNTLVVKGVGNDTLGPVSARGGSSITSGGTVSLQQNSTDRRRVVAFNAVTDEQYDIMLDIWDAAYDDQNLYYIADWTGLVDANASDRMDKMRIDYSASSILQPQNRGGKTGYQDFQVSFIV